MSENSIIDLTSMGVGDAVDPIVVGTGEYELRILSVDLKDDKNGNPYILPRFEVIGEPTAKELSLYIGLPNASMDEKKLNGARLRLRDFLLAFNQDISAPLTLQNLIGETAYAILGVKNDETYGEQNTIKTFVLPK